MDCPKCGEPCQHPRKEWVYMNPRCWWSEGDSFDDEDDYDPLDSGTDFRSVDRNLIFDDIDDDDDPIIG